ncbi:MAG: PH domain-containing protein [Treponema sp.]
MQRNKTFSIITIICFCSVIFIPIGLVLMWYSTQWAKKRKFILSGIMTIVYVAIVCFLMLFEPNQSGSGSGLPFGKGNQNVESQYESEPDKSSKKAKQSGINPSGNEQKDNFPKEKEKLPKKVQKGESKALGKSFYTIMFFLFMLFIIIWQNLKAKKKTGNYENPYVDTKKYKLPLDANFKIPTVHFTKIELEENEKIIFATETTQKNQEGDFVVTDKRIIVLGKSENYEIPLQELATVSSVTNSVMQITSGTQKYYIFVPENQMKFAVATVHWILEKKL